MKRNKIRYHKLFIMTFLSFSLQAVFSFFKTLGNDLLPIYLNEPHIIIKRIHVFIFD